VNVPGWLRPLAPTSPNLRVGDAVLALAGGSFRTHVITAANLVAHKPRRLSFAAAATVPIPYLTAAFTLEHLGQMQAGDKVLIHAAAGGVGLAAVHLAQRAGLPFLPRQAARKSGLSCATWVLPTSWIRARWPLPTRFWP
jgi:NADPH-dependent curcumin reductase CurA